jgi:cell division protease FtsH
MVLSEEEKERIAYHEGGHAVLAYVLEHADPVHKVTILPTGMALGVTHQLPMEERHIHSRQYIEDSLCVRMGGRCAELLVYGDLSTGAANDLVGNTELARKMVREWGMSDAIGPMAWGSQGQVFLGEDLMHTRDYSEDTSKIIDDEVERILRSEEQRAMEVLSKHRGGLNAIARALLDNEIIDGAEVARLVDEAHGSPVHGEGAKSVPHFHEAAIRAPVVNGAGNGAGAANGHGLDGQDASAGAGAGAGASTADTGVDDAVAVPAAPAPPSAAVPPDAPSWPPPVWPPPPADPAHGASEGSST